METKDTITVAPSVLIMIARHAALQVEGVSRTGTIPMDVLRVLKGNPMASGVILDLQDNKATIDLYLIVRPGVSVREVSAEVQRAVTRAIQELVGMDVTSVNVHVEDVDFPLVGGALE